MCIGFFEEKEETIERSSKCRLHRILAKEPDPGKIGPMTRDTEVTPVI
jgi:hypothetical protein